jgi:Zn-dependent protease
MSIIFAVIVIIFSVVIHEVAHGYAADFLGDPTARLAGRLTLNPLGHLDPVGSVLVPALGAIFGGFIFGWAKPVPYNPYNLKAGRWGPALVALAGPATNLLLAVIFGLIIRLTSGAVTLISPLGFVVQINIMLAIFNLIPVPPLDGSKLLFALLPNRWLGVERWLERYQFVALILFLLLILNGPWLSALVFQLFTIFSGLR